jgi:hypothetical protein
MLSLAFINENDNFCFVYTEDEYKNSNIIFSSEIKIKEHNTRLKIIKYTNDKDAITNKYDLLKVEKKINKDILPLCKSNLQKCIRRKEEDKAIKTALAIFNYNPNELLRRLSIIMIEDTLPHPKLFIKIIWFMCAVSKGYIMSISEIEDVLGIISTMCETDSYEVFNSKTNNKNDINYDNWNKLPETQKNFMWSLELRKIYGGMECDKRMITYHEKIWYERFNEKTQNWWDKLNEQTIYTIELSSVDEFNKEDILIESIDNHPFPFIKNKISEKCGFTPNDIGLIIWMCRSRINVRNPINELTFIKSSRDLLVKYDKIKKELDGFSNWLLNKLQVYV